MMTAFDPFDILLHFYPDDNALRRMLFKHSLQVRLKALAICSSPLCPLPSIDLELVSRGAMLHDIGICRCHAPGIHCQGQAHYIAHGIIGGEMLRDYQKGHPGLDLEPYARICERHTGTGLTREDIRRQKLPLPDQDFLPETPEEKAVCLADKFFSKSGDMKEKSLAHIRQSMEKFGPENMERFNDLCRMFGLPDR